MSYFTKNIYYRWIIFFKSYRLLNWLKKLAINDKCDDNEVINKRKCTLGNNKSFIINHSAVAGKKNLINCVRM